MRQFIIIIFTLLFTISASAQTAPKPQDVSASKETGQAAETVKQLKPPMASEPDVGKQDATQNHKCKATECENDDHTISILGLKISDWIALGLGTIAIIVSVCGLRQNRITIEKQNRAYIGVESVRTESIKIRQGIAAATDLKRPAPNPMKVLITIKNAGVTPARNVKITFQNAFDNGEGEAELPKEDKTSSFGSMMPNSKNSLEINISKSDGLDWLSTQNMILKGKIKLHVYGIIEYVDAFEKKNKTEFHAVHTNQPIDGSEFAIGIPDKNFMT